ncbi:hypothetical protein [Streptomyces tauricus]
MRYRDAASGPARHALLRAQQLAAARAVHAALHGGTRTVRIRVPLPP